MSGTSIDGLDFSLIKSDGISKVDIIRNKYYKFNNSIRNQITDLVESFELKKNLLKMKNFIKLN